MYSLASATKLVFFSRLFAQSPNTRLDTRSECDLSWQSFSPITSDDEYIDSDALSISSSVEDVMDCDTNDYNGDCGRDCDSSDENETSTNLESANNNVATFTQPQHDSESQHLESCVIHACSEHTETETEEQVKSSCRCYRHFTTMAALPVPVLAPAVFPTPDLHDFKYSDLFKATEDEISAIAWCQNNGLIAKDKMDYVIQDELQFQLGIVGEHTIVDWKNFCRDICLEYFIRNPVVIGGPGQTVEIDECLLVRRKYNDGHQVREQWVFGGYDVATKVGFMVPVDRRDAATLLPIIQKYIAPGTTIISDLWAAYNTIGTLGYQHLTSSSHSILLLESSRYEEIANVSEDEDGKEGVAKVMEDGTVPPILRL
eukprot:Em0004g1584a